MRTEEAARKGAEKEQADLKRSYATHKAKLAVFDRDIDQKRAQNATLSTGPCHILRHSAPAPVLTFTRSHAQMNRPKRRSRTAREESR